jgi:hypothetical protein
MGLGYCASQRCSDLLFACIGERGLGLRQLLALGAQLLDLLAALEDGPRSAVDLLRQFQCLVGIETIEHSRI